MVRKFTNIFLLISLIFNILFSMNYFEIFDVDKHVTNENNIRNHLNSLTIKNFEDDYNSDKKLIIYFGRDSCLDCNNFNKFFVGYIEDNYRLNKTMLYVDVQSIYNDKKLWENFKKSYGIKGTPSIVIYNNKHLISKLDFEETGGFSSKDLENWIKSNQLAE